MAIFFSCIAALDQQTPYGSSTAAAEDSQSSCFPCRCIAPPRVMHSPSSEPLAFYAADRYFVWHDTMCDEIKALRSNHTWSLVPFHPSMNIVGSRWVYRIKRRVDGSVER
jgi:hypothetical protein